jgi:16S rRNA (guanine966-N2)-methyltransferase
MRIIAGEAGGIPLLVPDTLTRPTTDRVREALFSSLGDRVVGARVLDLYAGSGALGLEALSRGAAAATFVDQERNACGVIADNLKKARLRGEEILCQPVRSFLDRRFVAAQGEREGSERCAVIFADPPYARDAECTAEIEALLSSDSLVNALEVDGVLVFESLARVGLPVVTGEFWDILRERRYGDTLVSFLRAKPSSADPGIEEGTAV